MSEKESFKKAKQALTEGSQEQAAEMLRSLYSSTKNKQLKLQIALALQAALNQADDVDELLETSKEGLELAEKFGDKKAIAYLSARRASNLHHRKFLLNHRQQQLVTARGWKGFALERDKKLFDDLQIEIVGAKKEIQNLIDNSIKLTNEVNKPDLKAEVLFSLGQVYSQNYFDYKVELLNKSNSKRFVKFSLLKPLMSFNLDNYILFSYSDRKALYSNIKSCKDAFLQGAKAYEAVGYPVGQAYALVDLANHLRTFNRFRQAKKILEQAKPLVVKYGNKFLSGRVEEIEKSIKVRNRDVPDYLDREKKKGQEPF